MRRNCQTRRVVTYPYHGQVFQLDQEMDLSVPLDEREYGEHLVYESECDIQEVTKAANPSLIAGYSVYFPFDPKDSIPIRAGMRFNGSMGGIDVAGMITNVILSQVGGVVIYVKDYDADEGD